MTIRVQQADVRGGQVVISGLPLSDGKVDVIVTDADSARRNIKDVRGLLRGGVERYDDPFEPVISPDAWEMLK
jgi:hypothetical protein